jgi:hypothetical protein
MPYVELKAEDIPSRGEKVRELLSPLSNKLGGPAWQLRGLRRSFIIGVHDGSPTQSDYRDWRFATFVPNYRGMYFELWDTVDDRTWFLDRAYLNIYQTVVHTQQEIEYLCLHCDPNESDEAAHAVYKKGPHLHIKGGTPQPIPHSHIALQQKDHLTIVLDSCDSLMGAMSWGVNMIKEEILDEIFKEMVNT